MAAHPDLQMFVRDARSLAVLTDAGLPRVTLVPDMAHQLWGVLPQAPKNWTEATGQFITRGSREIANPPRNQD